ncbi:hypothetical protein V5O48_013071 [Marasmius crinis-equi]|uniref:ABC transporter domain-containing protein n=1 Tax=Marasmius crinis-equi TaxID=585013 RepID=A0ABR3F128_9AGAR
MKQPTSTSKTAPASSDTEELETLDLGVYRVRLGKRPKSLFRLDCSFSELEERRKTIKLLKDFVGEILSLRPALFFAFLLVRVWPSMQDLCLMNLEKQLFQVFETGLINRSLDKGAALRILISRMVFVTLSSIFWRLSRRVRPKFEAAVKHYYDSVLLSAKLRMDLPTLQDNISHDRVTSTLPWETMEILSNLLTPILALTIQLAYVSTLGWLGNHRVVFIALCVFRLVAEATQDSLWAVPRIVEATDKNYLRMIALESLTSKHFRHDILSGNFVEYIISQFGKAMEALGDTPVDDAEDLYADRNYTARWSLMSLLIDLPSMYCTVIALLQPETSPLGVTQMATLYQCSTILRRSLWDIFVLSNQMHAKIGLIQQLHDMRNTKNVVQSGVIPYPKEKHVDRKGMELELRNVSFSYPGDPTKKVLDDVSFRIPAGTLIVIVGVNGSGKSSFINLLTRMYDVSSGQILVDGENIRDYTLSAFREATATLTQEHRLLPLSIAENIALGNIDEVEDMRKIQDAARMGGCTELIEKLESGYETIFNKRTKQHWGGGIDETDKNALISRELKKLQKTNDVSGGQRQRLVAARTFMRLTSPSIKFVAVDEPSSALDPEGELELFNNLRAARNGRTMLFVTHRFGPITKHADLILCMKEGKVIESGTHPELMRKEGEYCKMYNIQAKPFGES